MLWPMATKSVRRTIRARLSFDWNAWIGAFGRFFPVGFYYRAFFRPRGAWRFWEPIIRRMAGIGRVDIKARHGYYDKAYLFADVAVVGGGPAGLSAALAAAEEGRRVRGCRRQSGAWRRLELCPPRCARCSREERARRARAPRRGVLEGQVLTGASCEGLFADNWLAIVRDRRLYKLRADRVVLATGAFEQPAVFRNNDLPGIMFGSAAQRLIRLYGVRPGRAGSGADGERSGIRRGTRSGGCRGGRRGGARSAGRPA